MKLRAILLVLVLAGCGTDHDNFSRDNHGYGWEYAVQGQSGLRLRYEGPAQNIAVYELLFEDFKKCSGFDAPAPFVIVLPGFNSRYYRNPSLIVIGYLVHFRHELGHHALDHTFGNPDANHSNGIFAAGSCASM